MNDPLIDALGNAAEAVEKKRTPDLKGVPELMRDAALEIKRLRNMINSRPAVTAGLFHEYVMWTQGIFHADHMHATRLPN